MNVEGDVRLLRQELNAVTTHTLTLSLFDISYKLCSF